MLCLWKCNQFLSYLNDTVISYHSLKYKDFFFPCVCFKEVLMLERESYAVLSSDCVSIQTFTVSLTCGNEGRISQFEAVHHG